MTPRELAAIHAAAFTVDRPWSEAEFESLLAGRGVALAARPDGFALIRVIADEAELLTIAVHPDAQNRGEGRRLMSLWMERAAQMGAAEAFLEVAADNAPALALYAAHGFSQAGRRPAYYVRPGRPSADALLMKGAVTHRQLTESTG